jgi:hypothetical protein
VPCLSRRRPAPDRLRGDVGPSGVERQWMVAPMVTRRAALSASSFTDFGTLLRVLQRRARLAQRELGLAVGYSEAPRRG